MKALALALLTFCSCGYDNFSKENFQGTTSLGDGLYSEHYLIANYGVGGDVYSAYVTDSLTFRKLVMLYYDSDHVEFEITGGNLIVNRMTDGKKSMKDEMHSVLDKTDTLNISILKNSKISD